MNVRRRLIAGFVGVAIFVLVLFGFVAHRAALDLELDRELELLTGSAHIQANTMALSARHGVPHAQLFGSLGDAESLMVMRSPLGGLLLNKPLSMFLDGIDTSTLVGLLNSEIDRGVIKPGGKKIIWVRIELKSTGETLLVLHRHHDALSKQSKMLGIRLFVTALIIVWLAVWIALMLASRIVRVLEEQNQALTHQALYDELTELPNRRHLFDYLAHRIKENTLKSFGVFVLDFNSFKEVNDTLGHLVGDELLKQSALRLRKALPEVDMIARLGGDEFAIVVNDVTQMPLVSGIVHGALGVPINLQNMDITLDCSSGGAIYPKHASNAETLVQHAEVAMYYAKRERIQCQLYDAELDPHSVRRLTLMGDLRYAVERGQLYLLFQPKVDLTTLRTTSAEALIRWNHPEFGMISPDEFVLLAEQSDFIIEMSQWVLEEATRSCKQWHAQGINIGVAVNLSVRNLHNERLPLAIAHILSTYKLAPQYLKLEITESTLMADPQRALEILNQLAALKLTLSIDDFGTGYSSLSYLKKLPVNELKIDKSFVQEMMIDESDRVIVHSTINLAHNLGCSVVAEGIEDEQTFDALRADGCDIGQGYYISRPISADELAIWLTSCRWPAQDPT